MEKTTENTSQKKSYAERMKLYNTENLDVRQIKLKVAETLNSFSCKIALIVAKNNPKGNISIAPISIYFALSIVAEAMNPEKSGKLLQFLNVYNKEELENMQIGIVDLIKYKSFTGEYDEYLQFETSIWHKREYEVVESFKHKFITNLEGHISSNISQQDINSWVTKVTNKVVSDFEHNDAELDELIILNVVLFQGKWHHPFDESQNKELDFTGTKGVEKVTYMLQDNSDANEFFNTNYCTALYRGYQGVFKGIFVKPSRGNKPIDLISYERMASLINSDHYKAMENVDVMIPRVNIEFKVEMMDMFSSRDIKDVLKEVPLSKIFKDDKSVGHVSKIIHQVKLNINESGTSMVATTSVSCSRCMKETFILNEPFLYILKKALIIINITIVNHF